MNPNQALIIEEPWRAAVREEPDVAAGEGTFLAQTIYSGISTGTELSFFKGTNPSLTAGWNAELGLFDSSAHAQPYPVDRLGYMEVARVAESQTPAVKDGDIVAMTYGHRTRYRADPLSDRFVRLPDDLDPVLGIYVAHMGPICANGLLYAAADAHGADVRTLGDGVHGRRVAVVGAGVVGLLTALFARHHGAEEVVIVEPTRERRGVCGRLGFEPLAPEVNPAVVLKARWRHGPADRGADVVFQCRGTAASLVTALRLLRPQGTVVDLAFYQQGAEDVRLGEEFHHNGLAIRCAQIGRVPRGLGHLWDRERLSAQTLDLLGVHGKAVIDHLITDVVPLAEGPALFASIARRERHVLQAVLAFDT